VTTAIHYSLITVPPNRQRREHDPAKHQELVESLRGAAGLMHPLVIRQEGDKLLLVAGERRLLALQDLWAFGQGVRHGGEEFPVEHVPVVHLGELTPIAAWEAELEENIRRDDLSWQDRAKAEAELLGLRRAQAQLAGQPRPSHVDLAQELEEPQAAVRQNVILANNLHRAEVRNAKSASEAMKVLKRAEERERNEELAGKLGTEYLGSKHTLVNANCVEWMRQQPPAQFDVVLTDPPYGMGANEFGDSGGGAAGAHFYDDSPEAFQALMYDAIPLVTSLCKPEAHLYWFCDLDWFPWLKEQFASAGWTVFRTPLLWFKPAAFRSPWPEHGPQRKYETILYARRGTLTCTKVAGDVLQHAPDENLGHQAQKPVALYQDLLSRSARPGMRVLDPFCGTGPILPAGHALSTTVTALEQDPASFAIAAQRLTKLREGEV